MSKSVKTYSDYRRKKIQEKNRNESNLKGSFSDLLEGIGFFEKDPLKIEFDKALLKNTSPVATVELPNNSVVELASDEEKDLSGNEEKGKGNLLLWGLIILIVIVVLIIVLKQIKVI